jgi:hypothetical protein
MNIMKSYATAAILAAPFLATVVVAPTSTTSGPAMKGMLIARTVPSTNVVAPLPITYYAPKNHDAKPTEPNPRLIQLHGGDLANGVNEDTVLQHRVITDESEQEGLYPATPLAMVTRAAVGMATPAEAQRTSVDPPTVIAVEAKSIATFSVRAPDQRRFGMVEYVGGLELKSSHREFGGFSAIRVASDGEHFVSLTDRGWWLTGRIVSERGRPVGIAEATMAPMLGPDGRPLAERGWHDTESLAERDGWLYVGIEGVNRIVRFDFDRQGLLARAEVVSAPPAISHLPSNKGLEALTFAPRDSKLAGALMGFSERGLDGNKNLKAFLIGGAAPGQFSVKRRDNFDISDSATLPSGDVLLLERRFSWWTGIAIRLRRIAISDIAPDVLVDGTDLLFADLGYQIDNMEGLSVHLDSSRDVVLTLISDDNFSLLQRTLLLQFKLFKN